MYSIKWSNSAQFDVSVQGVSSLYSLLLGAFACEAQLLASSRRFRVSPTGCDFVKVLIVGILQKKLFKKYDLV
jgi:hypothetical protein